MYDRSSNQIATILDLQRLVRISMGDEMVKQLVPVKDEEQGDRRGGDGRGGGDRI